MRKIYTKQDKTNQKFTTPEVVDYGMILFTDLIAQHEELLSYMVMPRYGQNLEAFFEKQNCSISNASILEIARGTLQCSKEFTPLDIPTTTSSLTTSW